MSTNDYLIKLAVQDKRIKELEEETTFQKQTIQELVEKVNYFQDELIKKSE